MAIYVTTAGSVQETELKAQAKVTVAGSGQGASWQMCV